MAKTISEVKFNGETFKIVTDSYAQGGGTHVALETRNKQPFCVLSANFPDQSGKLPKGTFYLKDWSENAPIAAALVQQGDIVPVPDQPQAPNGARAYRLKEV